MHAYLPAIGFSAITKTELDELLYRVAQSPDYQEMAIDTDGNQFVELRFMVTDKMGIVIRGTYDDDDQFNMDYYFPVFYGNQDSTCSDIDIIKESDKESYHILVEDSNLGVSLILQLQNMGDYIKYGKGETSIIKKHVSFSGLSTDGKILLPIAGDILNKTKIKQQQRNDLMQAAKDGDDHAISDLTIDDIDTYGMIANRLQNNKEDVYSIVVSTFMPYGIENDKYMIIGEITDVKEVVNKYSMEEVVQLTVLTNDIMIDVCINKKNLLGEPAIGRRFKGSIWLQGSVDFQ